MREVFTRFIWSSPNITDVHGKRLHWKVRIRKDSQYSVGGTNVKYLIDAVCLEAGGGSTSTTEHNTLHRAKERAQRLAEVIGGYIRTHVDDAPGFCRIVRKTAKDGERLTHGNSGFGINGRDLSRAWSDKILPP